MDQLQAYLDAAWQRERAEKIIRYKILNEGALKGQILMAGSSLCEQFPINEMIQAYSNPPVIYNRGVSGDRCENLIAHMETLIFDLEPSKLFINIGSNDIAQPNYTEEGLLATLRGILLSIQKRLPHVKIYLLSYYPVNPDALTHLTDEERQNMFKTRSNDNINHMNERLAELAEEMSLTYIDVSTVLKDEKGRLKVEYTWEGIHMKPNGYALVLEKLMPYFS